jgi:ribosome maturation factor RimP
VNLYGPIDGKRVFEGRLVGLDNSLGEEVVVLMTEDGRAFLPRDKISKVQLIYEENEL